LKTRNVYLRRSLPCQAGRSASVGEGEHAWGDF
jgi:hypothetical protein